MVIRRMIKRRRFMRIRMRMRMRRMMRMRMRMRGCPTSVAWTPMA